MTDYSPVSRRQFIRSLTVVTAAAAVMPLLAGPEEAEADAPVMLLAGKLSDFNTKDYTQVHLPGRKFANVIQTKTGVRALSAACTHQGCMVRWVSDSQNFQCPCHGGQYDIMGKNIGGPPQYPLPVLATKIDADNNVYVQQPPPYYLH
jgi:Rieske Fe-S protein